METVIYHSADHDGIFCREIAKKFLPHDPNCDVNDRSPETISKPCNCTHYIGWNFGDPKIPMPAIGEVYILDLSPECLDIPDVELDDPSRVIWIDHHKTSIEKWTPDFGSCSIPGYRIDGVAACRLAWQWFHRASVRGTWELPPQEAFIKRAVDEPLAVRLAGEYDVWDHRGDGDLELQFGLRSLELQPHHWSLLLNSGQAGDDFTRELLQTGSSIKAYSERIDADLVTYKSYQMKWEGLNFLCLNHGRFNSNTFAAMDKPETGHDALLGYMFNGKCWIVSLYHAKHRTDIDLSVIAVKHGGGGHKGACGFTCKTLPFPVIGT